MRGLPLSISTLEDGCGGCHCPSACERTDGAGAAAHQHVRGQMEGRCQDNRCMMPYASLVPLLEGYPHLRLLDVRQSMLDSSDTERHVLKPEQLPWLGQQMRLLICGDKGLLCDARLNGKAAMREKILDEASDHLTSRAPWQPGPQPTACEHAGCCDSDVSTCLPAWRCPSAGALHGPGPWLLR
eukprot:354318-Chlamydomonas_euryale.AAC.20